MQTGNFFDIVFDGQSSNNTRDGAVTTTDGRPDPARSFVGVAEHRHPATGEPLVGGFAALATWVAPGGAHANDYRESVIWADLRLDA